MAPKKQRIFTSEEQQISEKQQGPKNTKDWTFHQRWREESLLELGSCVQLNSQSVLWNLCSYEPLLYREPRFMSSKQNLKGLYSVILIRFNVGWKFLSALSYMVLSSLQTISSFFNLPITLFIINVIVTTPTLQMWKLIKQKRVSDLFKATQQTWEGNPDILAPGSLPLTTTLGGVFPVATHKDSWALESVFSLLRWLLLKCQLDALEVYTVP